jgi:diguanylate cyclase (GGDEF)-like protein
MPISVKEPMRVLIVDDEAINIELAAAFLKEMEGIKIHYAQSGEAALHGVRKHDFDLILLDINMPEMDGFQVCRLLKRDPKMRDIPVIFLTAQEGSDFVTRAFEEGGVDYILKPFNGEEFKARVRTQLKLRKTLKELQRKQSRLAELSITDRLTGCYNQLFFQTRLKPHLQREGVNWMVRVHVENLQKVDRLFGSHRAEKVLQEVATILEKSFYRSDLCARLYGAHFALLVPGRERDVLEKVLQKASREAKASPLLKDIVTLAFAACRITPEETVASLMKRSYELLQRAKMGSSFSFVLEK